MVMVRLLAADSTSTEVSDLFETPHSPHSPLNHMRYLMLVSAPQAESQFNSIAWVTASYRSNRLTPFSCPCLRGPRSTMALVEYCDYWPLTVFFVYGVLNLRTYSLKHIG
jgi:hypothetical protein